MKKTDFSGIPYPRMARRDAIKNSVVRKITHADAILFLRQMIAGIPAENRSLPSMENYQRVKNIYMTPAEIFGKDGKIDKRRKRRYERVRYGIKWHKARIIRMPQESASPMIARLAALFEVSDVTYTP